MKVSIVTPVFNDVRVARALDSILSQGHDHELELIVIDAGSNDGTLKVLETYRDRISSLVSEPDKGIYDGMNKGIARATGDVVGILNADDWYFDGTVIASVAEAFYDDRVDACYGDMVYTDSSDRVVRYWKAGSGSRLKWYFGWMPPHPTFFVRRNVYERYGAFDLRYSIASDYELMLRLLLKYRINAAYIERVLVKMTPGGTSNSSFKSIVMANLEVGQAWRNNSLSGGFLVPLLKPSRKLQQFFSRPS